MRRMNDPDNSPLGGCCKRNTWQFDPFSAPTHFPVCLDISEGANQQASSESDFIWTWNYHSFYSRVASFVLGLSFAIFVALDAFALSQTQESCQGLLCNPTKMTVVQHVLGESRERGSTGIVQTGTSLEANTRLKGVKLDRLILAMVFNNTGIKTKDSFQLYREASKVQLSLENNPFVEVNVMHHSCQSWQHTSCIDTPVTLKPCRHVSADYLRDVKNCAAKQCEDELKLALKLQHSMCLDKQDAVVLEPSISSLRIQAVKRSGLTASEEKLLSLIEILVVTPQTTPELSDDMQTFEEPKLTWPVLPINLMPGFMVYSRIRKRRQDYTLWQLPWNSYVKKTFVRKGTSYVNLRSAEAISTDSGAACSLDVPRGSCLLSADITQEKTVDEIIVEHKSLFAWLVEMGGILSLVSTLGMLTIKKYNETEFHKRFMQTYGSGWARKMSQIERDTCAKPMYHTGGNRMSTDAQGGGGDDCETWIKACFDRLKSGTTSPVCDVVPVEKPASFTPAASVSMKSSKTPLSVATNFGASSEQLVDVLSVPISPISPILPKSQMPVLPCTPDQQCSKNATVVGKPILKCHVVDPVDPLKETPHEVALSIRVDS